MRVRVRGSVSYDKYLCRLSASGFCFVAAGKLGIARQKVQILLLKTSKLLSDKTKTGQK